jgi:hypothetical protein
VTRRSSSRTPSERLTRRGYLLRDRDSVYGSEFTWRVAGLELTEVLTAAGAPWQKRAR